MKSTAIYFLRKAIRAARPADRWLHRFPAYISLRGILRDAWRAVSSKDSPSSVFQRALTSRPLVPNTVFFESFWGRKIGCNPLAVYEAMREMPQFYNWHFIWSANSDTALPEALSRDPRVTTVAHNSSAYAEALATSSYIINNMTLPKWYLRRNEQEYVMLWHGVPIKAMGLDADRSLVASANTQRNFFQASRILLASKYAAHTIVDPYASAALSKNKISCIGSPRVDETLRASPNAIRSALNIPNGQRVILYAPTWRGKVSDISSDISTHQEAIFKLTRTLPENYVVWASLHNFVLKNLSRHSLNNINLVPADIDINHFLPAVDVLITDYSSIMVDYLPLNRPIVLYIPDHEQYNLNRGLYKNPKELPAEVVYSIDDLPSRVLNAAPPSSFSTYQASQEDLFPHEDGLASQRAVAEIFSPLKPSKMYSKKRRMLIYPGGLNNNGITTSFLSLVNNIDYEKWDVFAIVDAQSIDNSPEKLGRYQLIDDRCNKIFYTGRTDLTNKALTLLSKPNLDVRLSDAEFSYAKSQYSAEAMRTISNLRFDVAIDFSGYSPHWAMLIGAVTADRKAIFQHNHLWAEARNPHKTHLSHLRGVFESYRDFDKIVAVSEETRKVNFENLARYYGDDKKSIAVRNSIPTLSIKMQSNAGLGEEMEPLLQARLEGKYIFLCVGRLSTEKNHMRLIHAFRMAHRAAPNSYLVVVGDGELRKKLETMVSTAELDHAVYFTGLVDNPYPFYSASDCFVLSSDYEGQPMVLLEALSLGLPCIGTDIPGIRSVLSEDRGLLVNCDSASLAEAMVSYVKSKPHSVPFDSNRYNSEVMSDFYSGVCGFRPADFRVQTQSAY